MKKERLGVRLHPRILADMLESYLSEQNNTTTLKQERVLAWLIVSSKAGCRVTRFDAEIIGDHCLHSTVSTISKKYGLTVSREWTKCPTRYGETDLCQY